MLHAAGHQRARRREQITEPKLMLALAHAVRALLKVQFARRTVLPEHERPSVRDYKSHSSGLSVQTSWGGGGRMDGVVGLFVWRVLFSDVRSRVVEPFVDICGCFSGVRSRVFRGSQRLWR